MSLQKQIVQLLFELDDVKYWFELGVQLGMDTETLKGIEQRNDGVEECKREMLMSYTCDGADVKIHWPKIVTALRNMQENDIADKLHSRYGICACGDVVHVVLFC